MAVSLSYAVLSTSLHHLSKPLSLKPRFFRTRITCSNFNISFAPPKPKPKPKPKPNPNPNSNPNQQPSPEDFAHQLYIPWIVRDDNGNLTLQSTPPARLLHAISDAKTGSPVSKNNNNKKNKKQEGLSTPEPKYSKAARRFYNQNFRDPPQRLSKVLAAAGGNFHKLIIPFLSS